MNLSRAFALLAIVAALAFPSTSSAQSSPPFWKATVAYAAGDQVQDATRNVYRAVVSIPANTPNSTPSKAFTMWELNYVRTTTTLSIGSGQTFPNFKLAWLYLLPARIHPGVAVNIRFIAGAGTYSETFPATFSLSHPGGANISIAGDSAAKVTLHFPTTSGFFVDGNRAIASISNLTLDNASTANCSAIYARSNASIGVLSGLKFTGNWENLIYADSGATITVNGATNQWINSSATALTVAVLTSSAGLVRIIGTGFNYNGASKPGSYGFFASLGGRIEASGATIHHCAIGAASTTGSMVTVPGGKFVSNPLDLKAALAANIFATGGTFATKSVDATSHIFGP